MVERSLNAFDPFANFVDLYKELDNDLVLAHKEKDKDKIKRLLDVPNKTDYDLYICVNAGWHAFVLCAAATKDDAFSAMEPELAAEMYDPQRIPGSLLIYRFELCFDNEQKQTYKIRKAFTFFKDVEPTIKRSYYIGRYNATGPLALQLAAIRAAPHRYKAIIDDCVEFSKGFCMEMLSLCGNGLQIEQQVEENLAKASGSGLAVEVLSRKYKSSGLLGNLSLGGMNASFFFGARSPRPAFLAVIVLFLVVYPVLVAFLVLKYC